MRKAVDKLMVFFRFIIGTVRQLPVHPLQIGLQLKDMLESLLGLLHHSMRIREYHHLRQIADSYLFGNGNYTRCRALQTGQNFKHGRFTGSVLTHQGNTVFLVNNVRHVRK